MTFYSPQITLIQKNAVSVTPVAIKGDSALGNLTQYRMSGEYRDTINEITKNGQITLRSPFGLFDTTGPILTDEDTKDNYLIQVQLTQGANTGQLFRFEISGIIDNESARGKHITLNLTGYDIRTEEFLDSENLRLVTPKSAFRSRIVNFTTGRDLTSTGSIKLTYADSNNLLPDDDRLKQDWLPTEPQTTKHLLLEIINRVSSPQVVTSSNEDWYYSIVPQADTESFRIFVDRLGAVDSGVTIDVQTDGTKLMASEINAYFDNKKFKNAVIVKGKSGSHTIPMEFTRLASDLTHASVASVWAIGESYLVGDYVKSGNFYYKCKVANTASAGNAPVTSVTHWDNLSTSTKGSPWTMSTDLWRANMDGSVTPATGTVGYFADFNIVRKQYDRDDEFDEFEALSVKDVEAFLTTPADIPTGQIEHGRRWLVNGPATGTAWANHNNQIAQYDASVSPAVWRFSNNPTTGDIVNLRSNGTILRFNGTTWEVIWSISTNPGTPSPFIPVQSVSRVLNRHNLNKAIEFKFNWNVFDAGSIAQDVLNLVLFLTPITAGIKLLTEDLTNLVATTGSELLSFLRQTGNTGLVTALGVGNARNKASRRYGFSIRFPFPHQTRGTTTLGSKIKKHVVDFFNLTESMITGIKGWNNGIDSEDLGTARAVRWWVKLKHETHANTQVDGIANVKMIFWFRDLFDRIAIHRFTIPVHNAWQKITIPAGPESKLEIWDSRIDELFEAIGYVFPFNHFIQERELTGVKFDWSKVVEMGCVNANSYDDNLLYIGGQNAYLNVATEFGLQTAKSLAIYTGGLIDVENVITDHVLFAIDDLHIVKDAYVNTAGSKVGAPRMKMITEQNQFDYVNLRNNIGDRKISRLQYHPAKQTIYTRGDVRLVAGQRFTIINQNRESTVLVATQVDHIEDSTGYHNRITAIRKYEP